MERTTAPTVLDASSSLATCGSCGGTPLSGRQTSTWGLAGAGHQVGAAQGGRHQGPPESEGPQEGLAVPGGLTGEEWWVNKVGTYGMASAQSYWGRLAALLQGPLRTFPSSGLELRLCG